jgi:D-alanyl-D-alanine endopeptidase (penicillin-binding protein 7)
MKNKITMAILCLALSLNISYAKEDISAQSWVIANENGQIIDGRNTNEIRSIASITKLMTVMVVVDSNQSHTEIIPKNLYGMKMTRRQLMTLAIVKSDNRAAKYLCDYFPGGIKACITAMNEKAIELGMVNTVFTDATGLMHTNVSTAEDLIKLLHAASKYDVIHADSNKNVVVWNNKNKRVVFRNTNPIVADTKFEVSKTGYIRRAGGCIAMIVSSDMGNRIIVLLGSRTIKHRIPEARFIISKYI